LAEQKTDAEKAVETVFNSIAATLTKGEDVSVAGFW